MHGMCIRLPRRFPTWKLMSILRSDLSISLLMRRKRSEMRVKMIPEPSRVIPTISFTTTLLSFKSHCILSKHLIITLSYNFLLFISLLVLFFNKWGVGNFSRIKVKGVEVLFRTGGRGEELFETKFVKNISFFKKSHFWGQKLNYVGSSDSGVEWDYGIPRDLSITSKIGTPFLFLLSFASTSSYLKHIKNAPLRLSKCKIYQLSY